MSILGQAVVIAVSSVGIVLVFAAMIWACVQDGREPFRTGAVVIEQRGVASDLSASVPLDVFGATVVSAADLAEPRRPGSGTRPRNRRPRAATTRRDRGR